MEYQQPGIVKRIISSASRVCTYTTIHNTDTS